MQQSLLVCVHLQLLIKVLLQEMRMIAGTKEGLSTEPTCRERSSLALHIIDISTWSYT